MDINSAVCFVRNDNPANRAASKIDVSDLCLLI